MDILIIGGGAMGKTFAQSFLNAKVLDRQQIHILEKDRLKVELLNRFQLGMTYYRPEEITKKMNLIILAVKPQDTSALFTQIKAFLKPEHIVLSIMAGISIDNLKQNLGIAKIVRAMPNLPAQIGVGMTVFSAASDVNEYELNFVKKLLDTTGQSFQVEREEMLNAATAISGSGPAYVFYFMDAMVKSAMEMGFTSNEAAAMIEQTFLGSTYLYKRGNLSCYQWIEKVASRGGTTEAALKEFDNQNILEGIKKGTRAALLRAEELNSTNN